MSMRSLLVRFISCTVLSAAALSASAQQIGDWIAGTQDDGSGAYIATANESGGFLGKYCYWTSNSCVWIMGGSLPCNDGEKYTALLNADSGASPIFVVCSPIANAPNRYLITDPDLMDKAVNGARVGIAFPGQNSSFTVSRFNTSQASRALADLGRRMAAGAKSRKPGTKDITL